MMDPFYRGDTREYLLSFQLKPNSAPSVPIDISGDEIWVTLKVTSGSPDQKAPIQKKIVAPSNSTSESGNLLVTLTSEETGKLAGDLEYVFEIQRVIPSGDPLIPPTVQTVFQDTVRILQDATHRVS